MRKFIKLVKITGAVVSTVVLVRKLYPIVMAGTVLYLSVKFPQWEAREEMEARDELLAAFSEAGILVDVDRVQVLTRKLLHWSPLYRGVALDTMVKLATGEITEEEANRIMENAIAKEV